MAVYFLLLDAGLFREQIAPALAASWRRRSFAPCRGICAHLRPAARDFTERYRIGPDEPLLYRAADLPFDRDLWRALAGELFLYGAADLPTMQTAAATLCCLLAPERLGQCGIGREQFAAVEQAHFGGRDLVFGGGFYRPEQAGWNDTADVARLAGYLTDVDPERWTTEPLRDLPDLADETERAEELDFARECLQNLRGVYAGAADAGQVIVCERL